VSTPPTVEPVRYGNLRNPRRPGVAGLSLAATVLAGSSALAVVTSMMAFNLATAGVVLVVALVVLAPLVQTDREGHIGYQRIVARLRRPGAPPTSPARRRPAPPTAAPGCPGSLPRRS
jgi:hypothetical protein